MTLGDTTFFLSVMPLRSIQVVVSNTFFFFFAKCYSRVESDTTERLHFHFSLSCIGEGNGNPLQCSCLENPRDGGAWWADIYGVTQSRTRLKRLSSSSSSSIQGYRCTSFCLTILLLLSDVLLVFTFWLL